MRCSMSLSTRRNCAWRWTSSATSRGWLDNAIAGAGAAGAALIGAANGSASTGVMGAKRLACALRHGQTRALPGPRPDKREFATVAARKRSALPSRRGLHRAPGADGPAAPQGSGRLQRRPHRVVRDAHRVRQRLRLGADGDREERPGRRQPRQHAHPGDDVRAYRLAQGAVPGCPPGARRALFLRPERDRRGPDRRPADQDPRLRSDECRLLRRADRGGSIRGHQAVPGPLRRRADRADHLRRRAPRGRLDGEGGLLRRAADRRLPARRQSDGRLLRAGDADRRGPAGRVAHRSGLLRSDDHRLPASRGGGGMSPERQDADPAAQVAAELRARLRSMGSDELIDLCAQLLTTYVVEGVLPLSRATESSELAPDAAGEESFAQMLKRLKAAKKDPVLERFIVDGENISVRIEGQGVLPLTEYRRPTAPPPAAGQPAPAQPRREAVPGAATSVYNRALYQPEQAAPQRGAA